MTLYCARCEYDYAKWESRQDIPGYEKVPTPPVNYANYMWQGTAYCRSHFQDMCDSGHIGFSR